MPLPTAEVQRLSLRHHLALAALCAGQVDAAACATLLNGLYLAFYLHDARAPDLTLYRTAETVLDAFVMRVDASGPSALSDAEREVLTALVLHLDAQLAAAPLHRFVDAWGRLERVTHGGGRSPIPAAE
ncbi:hypothetical protein [Burkholderia ubonensis]|uniref:hypothetical protein n=1 Tax=Burkholderia ubonensis TaxID=101571 RepID=UPI001E65535C|nr:hypothetical protein [Burkholderia ubonensis]